LRRFFNLSRQTKESLSFPSLFLFLPFKKEKALYTQEKKEKERERERERETWRKVEILILKFVIFVNALFHQV